MPRKRNSSSYPPSLQDVLNAVPSIINKYVDAGGKYAIVNLEKGQGSAISGVAVIFDGGFECSGCHSFLLREDHETTLCNACRLALVDEAAKLKRKAEVKAKHPESKDGSIQPNKDTGADKSDTPVATKESDA